MVRHSVYHFAFALISTAVGFGAGYMFGNQLKKRLEKLIESILKYENGNFRYRIPSIGDDEIGLAADQLNEMAERIERQVASLQKLSNERAEWQDQMKKSGDLRRAAASRAGTA